MLMGTYERAGVALVAGGNAVGFRPGLLPNDLDRIRRTLRWDSSIFRRSPGRHQESGERALHVRAGRQSSGRSDQGLQNFWVACGVMAGLQPGRRRRTGAVALDGRRRSRRRYLGHGRGAIRRLDHAGLHQRQGARKLFAPLQHPLSERGALRRRARCAPRRSTRGSGAARGVRRLLRLEHPLWFAPTAQKPAMK